MFKINSYGIIAVSVKQGTVNICLFERTSKKEESITIIEPYNLNGIDKTIFFDNERNESIMLNIWII